MMTEFQMNLFKDKQGVYLLIKDRSVVYVGQSKDIYRRLHEHQYERMDIDFDKAFAVQGSWHDNIETTLILEMAYICHYQPICNTIKFDNYYSWFFSLPSFHSTNVNDIKDLIKLNTQSVLMTHKFLISQGLIHD